MERKLVKIGEAAALIGSTPATLRKWESTGELLPARKTKGGTRYYAVADLLALGGAGAPTICYARVSGQDQKSDLMNDEPAKQAERLVVITDTIPVQKQRKAVEKAIKQTLARMLPAGVTYDLLHHPSCSNYGLQVADYCNWAVLRKWQRGKTFYYDKLRRRLFSESDIFRLGAVTWY